jgi:hypothetical protein
MERTVWKKAMKAYLGAVALIAVWELAGAHQSQPFYNVDAEVRIQGTVREILFEPRYDDRAPFLVIALDQKDTGQKYRIDISPSWFFGEDLHQGEKIEVIGSLVRTADDTKQVIARELHFRGETLVLRDARGFPEWRGGRTAKGARRRGRSR